MYTRQPCPVARHKRDGCPGVKHATTGVTLNAATLLRRRTTLKHIRRWREKIDIHCSIKTNQHIDKKMLLSEDHIKILDEILHDDTALDTETKVQALLARLQKLSSAEVSSGGGENLTPKKRKKASGDDDDEEEEEEDATGQQQQQEEEEEKKEEEERSAYFETVEDAFKATIQEFDEEDEVKGLAFFVDDV